MSPEPVVMRFHLAGLPVAATNMDGLIAAVRNHFATRTDATPAPLSSSAMPTASCGRNVMQRCARLMRTRCWFAPTAGRSQPPAACLGLEMSLRCRHRSSGRGLPRGPRFGMATLFPRRNAGCAAAAGAQTATAYARAPGGWVRIAAVPSADACQTGCHPRAHPPVARRYCLDRPRHAKTGALDACRGAAPAGNDRHGRGRGLRCPCRHSGARSGMVAGDGLEWLYRALSEPRRLLRRYAVTVPSFLFLMLLMGAARLFGRGTG